jgi:plasmid stabilization system protein ParE
MEVFLSAQAEEKLLQLNNYLLYKWNTKIRDTFIEKLTQKINQISAQPESCPQSKNFDGLYKCVVTKQTTFYYRILFDKNEIEVITIFDTRQNPDKLSTEIYN